MTKIKGVQVVKDALVDPAPRKVLDKHSGPLTWEQVEAWPGDYIMAGTVSQLSNKSLKTLGILVDDGLLEYSNMSDGRFGLFLKSYIKGILPILQLDRPTVELRRLRTVRQIRLEEA